MGELGGETVKRKREEKRRRRGEESEDERGKWRWVRQEG